MSEIIEAGSMPLVTSLSETDSLITAEGHRIKTADSTILNASANLVTGAKWIRVGTVRKQCMALISISNHWNAVAPTPVVLACSLSTPMYSAPGDCSDIRLLAGKTVVFSKARIVYDSSASTASEYYLEVYCVANKPTSFYVECLNSKQVEICCELGSIPEGYTTKEFDLSGG